MSDLRRVVIVGGGLAGATAARTLREEGFDGQVVLVGDEHHPPYERPPLSKDYLRGESRPEQAYVEPERYWAERDVLPPEVGVVGEAQLALCLDHLPVRKHCLA